MMGPMWICRPPSPIPLGMAIHELTTNTVKYDALSVLGGSVSVTWALAQGEDHYELTIEWVKRSGPVIGPPTRRGFGSQLLERVLNNQIGARSTISYEPEGLRAHIAVLLPFQILRPLRWIVSPALKSRKLLSRPKGLGQTGSKGMSTG